MNRADRIATWAIGLGSIVQMASVWLIAVGSLESTPYAEITAGYMVMLGIVAGARQAVNGVERLPGRREWVNGAPRPEGQ